MAFIVTLSVFLLLLVASILWQWSHNPPKAVAPAMQPDTSEETVEMAPTFLVARDETLGSGLLLEYPEEWNKSREAGAGSDVTTLASPSGNIQVLMEVKTIRASGAGCTPDYLELKYLSADTLPKYADGRFASYVVFFPSLNLYQYHIGVQKNTAAVREVTIENNKDCAFFYSEFIERESSIEGVGTTSTLIAIRFPELGDGSSLKPGLTEGAVIEKMFGKEYEQAMDIARSVSVER